MTIVSTEIIGLLTWSVFVAELEALRGSAVVLQAKAKADKKISVSTSISLPMPRLLCTLHNKKERVGNDKDSVGTASSIMHKRMTDNRSYVCNTFFIFISNPNKVKHASKQSTTYILKMWLN